LFEDIATIDRVRRKHIEAHVKLNKLLISMGGRGVSRFGQRSTHRMPDCSISDNSLSVKLDANNAIASPPPHQLIITSKLYC